MNILTIENAEKIKLAVQIEPWAEVFYLRKGDTLKLHQPEGLHGYYHVKVWRDADIQLFVDGEYDYPEVFINDQPAEPWNDFKPDESE
ncbi:hypothetical protein BEN47_14370 [Hymenobacter lapidarius]|uniref:Uncharacterized protein n=1 Tax=Hymenobacter lapidarius TaxID=1908237 RepID=A0A1G1T4I6_9BACT|nr:hypothetical protein [Hymenobacter lapidarius]OGX85776.1 hypothetical protein BEN47_14370 [Hymenobacter lapidarius]